MKMKYSNLDNYTARDFISMSLNFRCMLFDLKIKNNFTQHSSNLAHLSILKHIHIKRENIYNKLFYAK